MPHLAPSDKLPPEVTILRQRLRENGLTPIFTKRLNEHGEFQSYSPTTSLAARLTPAILIDIWDEPAAKAVAERASSSKSAAIFTSVSAPAAPDSSCCAPTNRSQRCRGSSSRRTTTST